VKISSGQDNNNRPTLFHHIRATYCTCSGSRPMLSPIFGDSSSLKIESLYAICAKKCVGCPKALRSHLRGGCTLRNTFPWPPRMTEPGSATGDCDHASGEGESSSSVPVVVLRVNTAEQKKLCLYTGSSFYFYQIKSSKKDLMLTFCTLSI